MTTLDKTYLRVNKRGQIVVPPAYRIALGASVGDKVTLFLEDGELRITTMQRRLERAQRLVRKYVKPGTFLSDELIAERRAAAMRELK